MPWTSGTRSARDLLDVARGLLQHGIAEEPEHVAGHGRQVTRPFTFWRRTHTRNGTSLTPKQSWRASYAPAGVDVDPQATERVRGRRSRGGPSASQSASTVAARTSARLPSSTGPSTVTLRRRRAARRTRHRTATASPTQLGDTTERRPAQHSATRPFGLGDDERLPRRAATTTSCSGRRVWSRSTPSGPSRGRAGGRRARGATAPAPPRARPGREQLLVELEERDEADRTAGGHAVQHGLGADQHVGVGHGLRCVASTAATVALREQRREVVADARHARSDGPEPGAVAVQADRRSLGVAARAHEAASRSCTVAPHRSQRASSPHVRHASSRARPLRFSTHTDRPAGVAHSAQLVGEHGREQRLSGLLVARGRPPRRAATARASSRGAVASSSATSTSTVGAGVTTRIVAPARRARSIATSRAFQVGARSSSSASSASSTHDDAREVGYRRPHRGATTDDDARARPGAVPRRGELGRGAVGAQAHHFATLHARAMATSRAARTASGSITMLDPSGATSRDAGPARSTSGGTIISERAASASERRRVHRGLELGLVAGGDRRWAATRRAATWPAVRPIATRPSGTGRRRRPAAPPTRPRSRRADARPRPRARPRRGRAPSRARADRGAGPARSCRCARRAPARPGARSRTRGGLRERRVGRDRTRCDRASARLTRAPWRPRPSSSAASVRSHVKSRSERPKWPYAAVLRKIGRRRSSRSMIAAGTQVEVLPQQVGQLLRVDLRRPEGLDHHRDRVRRRRSRTQPALRSGSRSRRPRRSWRRCAPRTPPSGRPWSGPCR